MTDREKVLKGLECCARMRRDACQKCPYENECSDPYVPPHGAAHLAADALELLKAEKPVVERQIKWGVVYRCAECKHELYRIQNYCPWCGRAVKWDD